MFDGVSRATTLSLALATSIASGQCLQPPQGSALSLNGSSAYVSIPDSSSFDFSRTVTIEFWLRRNNDGEVISQSDGLSITSNRAFEVQANGAFFYRADGTGWLELYNNAPIGQWVHIATVINTTAPYMRKFVNGVLVAETSTGVNGSSIVNTLLRTSTRPVEIGRRGLACCGGPIYYLSGLVDELRVWNVARTPSQIAASFQGSVPTNSSGLVAYYTFDEGGGSTLIDRTGRGNTGSLQGGAGWASVGPPLTAVSIGQQPTSRTVCAGSGTTFSVSASGSSPQFQWRRNGAPIGGANGSSFTIVSPTPSDAGTYDCVVSNSCSSVTSSPAALTVNSPPVVASQPGSTAVCAGSAVTLVVNAANAATFQWRRNGAAVGGATSSTFTIASAATGDAGVYDCVVANGCGSVTSAAATVTVNVPPVITSHPASTVACAGTEVSLTIAAGGATGFQWRRGGVNVPGATDSTMTIPVASAQDAGVYDCQVRNGCGTIISAAATLTVNAATAIVTQPNSQSVMIDDTASFAVETVGTALTYQWRHDNILLSDGGRVTGSRTQVLTITGVVAADRGAYRCFVRGVCGELQSQPASLSCSPVVTSQPQGASLLTGQSIVLEPQFTTAGATSYRWRRDGVALSNSLTVTGVTTPTLQLIADDTDQAGSYTLAITNSCGTTVTSAAVIDVTCMADFNLDGGVDGSDLFAFFEDWEWGREAADVNRDGGIDGGDVTSFFDRWVRGC
jgi:hypothetical protein